MQGHPQQIERTLESGLTFFSAAEIRVVLVPLGDIPDDIFNHYASLITAHRQVELNNVRSFYKESQKSPFKFFPWKTGNMNFKFLSEATATKPNALSYLHNHRRTFGVLGILSCPHTKDLPKAYSEFEQKCRQFPDASTLRCLAFDPEEGHITENHSARPNLALFPPGSDIGHLSHHMEVVIHDFAACVVTALEEWMLNASPAMIPLSSLVDSPEFTGNPIAPFATEDEPGRIKRKYARLQKAMGDYSLLAGSPLDAMDHYTTAMELSRTTQDWTYAAVSLEGYAAAKLMYAAVSNDAFESNDDSIFNKEKTRGIRRTGPGDDDDDDDDKEGDDSTAGADRSGLPSAASPKAVDKNNDFENVDEKNFGRVADGELDELDADGHDDDNDVAIMSPGTIRRNKTNFGGRFFWDALRKSQGLEEEVRLLVEESKSSLRKYGGLPLLVEADIKWARLLAGLHGSGVRHKVLHLASSIQLAAELLPLANDRLTALTEAASLLGAVGASRKRVLLMWQAVELSKYFGFPSSKTLEVARRALEPVVDPSLRSPFESDGLYEDDFSIHNRNHSVVGGSGSGGGGSGGGNVNEQQGTTAARTLLSSSLSSSSSSLHLPREASTSLHDSNGTAWRRQHKSNKETNTETIPASWGVVRAGCLEATLGLAIYAKRHSTVFDVAAALLREHAAQLSPHRMQSLLDNLIAASTHLTPGEKSRPGKGPPPLLHLLGIRPVKEHLMPVQISGTEADATPPEKSPNDAAPRIIGGPIQGSGAMTGNNAPVDTAQVIKTTQQKKRMEILAPCLSSALALSDGVEESFSGASTGNRFEGGSPHAGDKDDGGRLFLYDPFAAKRKKEKEHRERMTATETSNEHRWIVGESGVVDMEVSNPSSVAIKIDKMVLEVECNGQPAPKTVFKPKPVSINVPAYTKPVRIQVEGTPLVPGKLRLLGCRCTAFRGVTWLQPWSNESSSAAVHAQTTAVSPYVSTLTSYARSRHWRSSYGQEEGVDSEERKKRNNDIQSTILEILPAMPQLTATMTGISQSTTQTTIAAGNNTDIKARSNNAASSPGHTVTLLHGQTLTGTTLTLTNTGPLPIHTLRVILPYPYSDHHHHHARSNSGWSAAGHDRPQQQHRALLSHKNSTGKSSGHHAQQQAAAGCIIALDDGKVVHPLDPGTLQEGQLKERSSITNDGNTTDNSISGNKVEEEEDGLVCPPWYSDTLPFLPGQTVKIPLGFSAINARPSLFSDETRNERIEIEFASSSVQDYQPSNSDGSSSILGRRSILNVAVTVQPSLQVTGVQFKDIFNVVDGGHGRGDGDASASAYGMASSPRMKRDVVMLVEVMNRGRCAVHAWLEERKNISGMPHRGADARSILIPPGRRTMLHFLLDVDSCSAAATSEVSFNQDKTHQQKISAHQLYTFEEEERQACSARLVHDVLLCYEPTMLVVDGRITDDKESSSHQHQENELSTPTQDGASRCTSIATARAAVSTGRLLLVHGEIYNGLSLHALTLLRPCAGMMRFSAVAMHGNCEFTVVSMTQESAASVQQHPIQPRLTINTNVADASSATAGAGSAPVVHQRHEAEPAVIRHGEQDEMQQVIACVVMPGETVCISVEVENCCNDDVEIESSCFACYEFKKSVAQQEQGNGAEEVVWSASSSSLAIPGSIVWTGRHSKLKWALAARGTARHKVGFMSLSSGLYKVTASHAVCGGGHQSGENGSERCGRLGKKNTFVRVDPCFVLCVE